MLLIYNGVIGYMPDVDEYKNPADRYASIIYSADGEEIGRFYRATGNRVYADYNDISQHVVEALIATEDVRYLDHSGIDAKALARAITKTIIMGDKSAGGGSTITQQLAKQLYSPESDNLFSRALKKPVEWMIAVKLERTYSKDEIIKMYLNTFDFLYNAVGIRSASTVYFGKEPKDLNVQEAAMLVGMVKNPAYYNPVRKPERTQQRRNVVFEQMEKAGFLTAAERDSLSLLPLDIRFTKVEDHKDGIAPYFREELRRMLTAKKPVRSDYPSWSTQAYRSDSANWVDNPLFGWIEKNPKRDGTKYDIYNDGLKIFTTIDTRVQKHAEDALVGHLSKTLQPAFNAETRGSKYGPYMAGGEVTAKQVNGLIDRAIRESERYASLKAQGMSDEEIMRNFNTRTELKVFSYRGWRDTVMTPRDSLLYMKRFLRAGFVAMDPHNGHVLAYVGGADFKAFQYDMVSTGRRQVGSTIKPLLYTYALEEGFTPCDKIQNTQPSIRSHGGIWRPKGSGGRIGQMVDLKWALTNSSNWISARLLDQLSIGTFIDHLHAFGVTSSIPESPSIALGACEISLRDMVTAYSAFANHGMRTIPMFVTSIVDSNGNVVAEFTPQQREVISERAYWGILTMLQSVVNNGTARRLRSAPFSISAQMGGKTGTTNSNSDAWFMGLTPEIVCAAWVGGDEKPIHFRNGSIGQGAAAALPIFGRFMRALFDDRELSYSQETKFDFPEGLDVCEGTGVATSNTYHGGRRHSDSSEGDHKGADHVQADVEGIFD